MVIDFVKVNSVTNVLPAILSRILDLLHIASLSRHFSKLDIRAGFHIVRMHPVSVGKPRFPDPRRMYFRLEAHALRPSWCPWPHSIPYYECPMDFLDSGIVIIYRDDILIHVVTKENPDHVLHAVLQTLQDAEMHLKLSKCPPSVLPSSISLASGLTTAASLPCTCSFLSRPLATADTGSTG